jgi:hypothetical protein
MRFCGMVRTMIRLLFRALALVTPAVVIGSLLLLACASSAHSACDEYAACCQQLDDPSSCIETAQSGELTNAQCESDLQMYVASGQCYADGGGPVPDAGPG